MDPSPVDLLPHKQSICDKPGILSSRAVVESSISDPHQMARFLPLLLIVRLALALPVSSCGLRLADEAVRVAAVSLDYSVRVPKTCGCGTMAGADGMHGLVCKQAPSNTARHQAINDATALAVITAGIPVTKDPISLTRLNGKQ